jgi:hypothetical protein
MQSGEHAEKAKEVAEKTYHPEHNDNGEELTITHEQVADTYRDGTIDIIKNGTGK